MLTLTNRRTNTLKTFKDFDHLYAVITAYEDARQAITSHELPKQWGMIHYGHRVVIYSQEWDEPDTLDLMREAPGSLEASVLQMLTEGDEADRRERWCRAYCALNGFGIVETPSYSDDPPASFEDDL